MVVPLFPFSNSSILCTSELSSPQYLRIVICLPLDILNCFLSWLIRLQNRLCGCWFQLVTPLSTQMTKILLATAWVLQNLIFQISEYAISGQTWNGEYRQKQKTDFLLSLQWQYKEKSMAFIQQRLEWLLSEHLEICCAKRPARGHDYHGPGFKSQKWNSHWRWRTERTERETVSQMLMVVSAGTSGDTWFSPPMGIRGVLWKKWLNEAENSSTWPKRWSRWGIYKINLKFKMYYTGGVGCVVKGLPAHLENHWWLPHFKWLYIQRCLKQYFCFLFWICLLYFVISPSSCMSVVVPLCIIY